MEPEQGGGVQVLECEVAIAHGVEAVPGEAGEAECPREGQAVTKDQVFGTIESVKAVSDLFAPVTGVVRKVNTPLHDTPEVVNAEPYAGGWLIEIEMSDPAQAESLMSAADYRKLLADQE